MLDRLPDYLNIALTSCAMGHPRGPFHWEGGLTLRDIEAHEDLAPLLRCWLGEYLYVENCPGFNDAILDMMATVEAEQFSCAPRMAHLDISDCPNFSAAALRRLVTARLQVHEGRTFPGFSVLCVSGLVPDISTEDQQYISQHVYEFDYYPSLS
jgi:hypothetical protein